MKHFLKFFYLKKLLIFSIFMPFWGISQNFSIIEKNQKFGLENKAGDTIVSPIYDDLILKEECNLLVLNIGGGSYKNFAGGKWAFFDLNGEQLTDFIYSRIEPCSFGLVTFSIGGEPSYDSIARVNIWKSRTWGLINAEGKELIRLNCEGIFSTPYEIAGFRSSGKWGLVKFSGQVLIKPMFDVVFPEGDYAIVVNRNKWGISDLFGNIIIPIKYDYITAPRDKYVLAKLKEKWGFLKTNGEVVIPFIYDDANSFENGIAIVKKGDLEFKINKEGKRIQE
jgi:hypothetical protein